MRNYRSTNKSSHWTKLVKGAKRKKRNEKKKKDWLRKLVNTNRRRK